MFPFHRKHNTAPAQSRATVTSHRGSSRFADKNEETTPSTSNYYNAYDTYVHESDLHIQKTRSYPKQHTQKPLREREDILISSMKTSSEYERSDNRIRLGPNKMNTFQCLKDIRTKHLKCDSENTCKVVVSDESNQSKSEFLLENKNYCDKIPFLLNEQTNLNLAAKENDRDTIKCLSEDHTSEITPLSSTIISSNDDCINKLSEKNFNPSLTFDHDIPIDVCLTQTTLVDETEGSNLSEDRISLLDNLSPLDHRSIDDSIQCNEKSNIGYEIDCQMKENLLSSSEKKDNSEKIIKQSIRTLLVGTNEGEYISSVKYVILNQEIISILKIILLGSEESVFIPCQWIGQSLVLNKNRKRCGLIQDKGGLCGILATVQAFILKALLFNPETATVCPQPFRPTTSEMKKALVHSISTILWQAGHERSAVLVKYNEIGDKSGNKENVACQKFLTFANLRKEVDENIAQFTDSTSDGCFLLVVSTLLSSGMRNVVADMDERCNPLISQNGLCSLELVMLLLTGHAISNVFDNTLHLGSYLHQGISKRSEIGFLSQYEHVNNYQVASNLKTPKYPIWVVNCENRFSVVYSDNMKLVSDWRAERQFSVYHYDTIQVNGDEEVKLTIDTTGLYLKCRTEDEYIPPLEICLRTKWKDAAISWNGIEPCS